MKCPQWGSDNTSDSRFCRSCAAPLVGAERSSVLTETIAIVLTDSGLPELADVRIRFSSLN